MNTLANSASEEMSEGTSKNLTPAKLNTSIQLQIQKQDSIHNQEKNENFICPFRCQCWTEYIVSLSRQIWQWVKVN